MLGMRYLPDVTTLSLDAGKCRGCRMCLEVCPHAVFEFVDKRARIADRDACMECGACAVNCPDGALTVRAGVGCAAAILESSVRGGDVSCDASARGGCS